MSKIRQILNAPLKNETGIPMLPSDVRDLLKDYDVCEVCLGLHGHGEQCPWHKDEPLLDLRHESSWEYLLEGRREENNVILV